MNTSNHQNGSVLIVSLILLVVLTLLSVSALNSTSLQERMVANTHEYTLAFASTEAALKDGTNWLGPLKGAQPAQDASCASNPTPCPHWVSGTSLWDTTKLGTTAYYHDLDKTWWDNNGIPFGGKVAVPTTSIPVVGLQPRYVIEQVDLKICPDPTDLTCKPIYYYAITGRGTARGTNAVTLVQLTYGKQF